MAVLYVTEFAECAIGPAGRVMEIAMEPSLVDQVVTIGGSSTQSSAFNTKTRFVRLETDSICSVQFGTNPTASTTTRRMNANDAEYFAVPLGQSFKVAVITNT